MVASCLKSIFISNPVDGKDGAIGSSVRVRSTGGGTDIFWLWSDPLLDTLLLDPDAILSLVAISCSSGNKGLDIYFNLVNHRHSRKSGLPIGVATVNVGTLCRAKNSNWLRSVEFCSGGANDSEQSNQYNLQIL